MAAVGQCVGSALGHVGQCVGSALGILDLGDFEGLGVW